LPPPFRAGRGGRGLHLEHLDQTAAAQPDLEGGADGPSLPG
jgi:hypothetical protein